MSEELKMDGVTDDTDALGGSVGEEQVPRAILEAQIVAAELRNKELEASVAGAATRIVELKAEIEQHVAEKQKLAEELKATAEANALNRQNLRNTAASIVDLAAQIGRAIA
jgi:chromosome segregation ATPase